MAYTRLVLLQRTFRTKRCPTTDNTLSCQSPPAPLLTTTEYLTAQPQIAPALSTNSPADGILFLSPADGRTLPVYYSLACLGTKHKQQECATHPDYPPRNRRRWGLSSCPREGADSAGEKASKRHPREGRPPAASPQLRRRAAVGREAQLRRCSAH